MLSAAQQSCRPTRASLGLAILLCLLFGFQATRAALYYQQQQPQQQPSIPIQNGMFMVANQQQTQQQQQSQQQQQQQQLQQQQQYQQALLQEQQQQLQAAATNTLINQQQQQQQQQPQQQQQQQPNNVLANNNGQPDQLGANPISSGGHSLSRPLQEREAAIFRYNGVALNSSTVKLVWNLLSGYHADYFNIEWGPIPDATQVFSVNKLNGTARDYTFHGLQPDTLYQFQLSGFNAGHSYKPQLVAVKTLPANYQQRSHQESLVNRDIMPLGVKAESKSNNSIQLSWTEADKPANLRNSIRVNIIRYYVNPSLQQQASSAAGSSSAPLNESSSSSSSSTNSAAAAATPQYHYLNVTNARESRLIVQKLRPATEYAFAVKTAYYAPDMKKIFTQSGFSMDSLARTLDIEPTAPRNFTIKSLAPTREEISKGQSGQLELNWAPPESPNGQLKGYVILYTNDQLAPDEQWSRINVSGADIRNWHVANIQPGWSYYFKLRAINQRGESADSETRLFVAPSTSPPDKMINNATIPANNVLLLIVICMIVILFILSLLISKLTCRTRRKAAPRKGSLNNSSQQSAKSAASNNGGVGGGQVAGGANSQANMPKLNGFASTNSASTVVARVGTMARRRENSANKPDFWISAMDQKPDTKSVISEKSNSDLNMAMVSIQRDSPQFATTQLAPALPDYRFASAAAVADQQLMQQLQQAGQQQQQQQQQQSHYHPGQLQQQQFVSPLGYDQMDNATASALMTLSKRQQQQLQKYQIQFAGAQPPTSLASSMGGQALSPHQQPPPPPPLNIEQQHQQQSIYGTHPHHQTLANTRSLRLHRPTLYDPVSGSFVQSSNETSPPQYNTHHMHTLMAANNNNNNNNNNTISQFHGNNSTISSNTLQFHPHQTSTLMSRRSTNTLRSFQTGAGAGGSAIYGQLTINTSAAGSNQFGAPPPLSSLSGSQQPQQLLQSHQAVINQLNNSTYPSLPLKHVSAVRPQIMSSLEDRIELELAEKEQQQTPQGQPQQQQQTQHQH